MPPDSSAVDWSTVAAIRARLLAVPTFPREEDLRELLALVTQAMGTRTGYLVLTGHLADAPDDVLFGWRIVVLAQHSPDWMREVVYAFELDSLEVVPDPWLQRQLRETGRLRTYRAQASFDAHGWHDSPIAGLLRALGTGDRVEVVLPCLPHAELVVGVDRPVGDKHFEAEDEATLVEVTRGFDRIGRRLALSLGTLGPGRRVTPRERETLRYLLGPLSEKEIAAALSLTPRSLHQYVVSLYRKFGVHGRAELIGRIADVVL